MTYLYILFAPGFIKVGSTINVARRWEQHRQYTQRKWGPLKFVGWMPFGVETDISIRARMNEPKRGSYDWFATTAVNLEIVKGLPLLLLSEFDVESIGATVITSVRIPKPLRDQAQAIVDRKKYSCARYSMNDAVIESLSAWVGWAEKHPLEAK